MKTTFIIILTFCSLNIAGAQQKRVYARQQLLEYADSLLRVAIAEESVRSLVSIDTVRSHFIYWKDTVGYPELIPGNISSIKKVSYGGRIHYESLTDIDSIETPFGVTFWYRSHLPTRPDAIARDSIVVSFDSTGPQKYPSVVGIYRVVPWQIWQHKPYQVLYKNEALSLFKPKVEEFIRGSISEEAFKKSFRLAPVSQTGRYGSYISTATAPFVTSQNDTLIIPTGWNYSYQIYPVDNDSVAIIFNIILEENGNFRHISDSIIARRTLDEFPDFIKKGTPSHILSKDEAIKRVLELGLPIAKAGEKYICNLSWVQKQFVWSVFSVQEYKYHSDMIGNSVDYQWGEEMQINAITGAFIKRIPNGLQRGGRRGLQERIR